MMRILNILVVTTLLTTASVTALASTEERSSANRGYVKDNKPTALVAKVESRPALLQHGPRSTGPQTKQVAGKNNCFNCSHPDFTIFEAETEIFGDQDYDGFYHALEVSFDVDNLGPADWVYARLFLSLEGGPWNEYAVTEDFFVRGLTFDDTYTLETELLSGYPTGYYDVLIEIYHADSDAFLTLSGPDEDHDLSVLALEDLDADYYREVYHNDNFYYGGGGSMNHLALILMLSCVAFRYRRKLPSYQEY